MDFNTPLQSLNGWPAAVVLAVVVLCVTAVIIAVIRAD
ncbi:Uncharacterised protein [Mycobacteroides abscessus]|uniref:Uncharacterized protein n=1 Tax=Mycobacteroides abscessus TaxID=36809 RepID=A0AB33TBK2_9MYCO|nr:Uncharacterised protein [Mycobacteroides abscessus]SHV70266.1 Uncharacterised protein [Mycobacteroides abscessus subsp. abscessus]SKI84251.1 Uncharacterised protein [Mycobacteroides abscessus subsp. massiliense]CPT77000.1 Uncharacterised protein [Mycobacteroides abscessus]CPV17569.1 Uncharacterised protein [Mycobacteroides abscessus]